MNLENPDDLRALMLACDDFAMLDYWREAIRGSVVNYLARLCPHREALRWLVREVTDHVGKWPGPAEIRGILCTRFDPADGVDGYSTIAGYRPEDAEMRYRLRETESYAGLLSPGEALAALVEHSEPPAVAPRLRLMPPVSIELKPSPPPNAYELNLIRAEANDERLSPEARDRAKRILERMEKAG